MGAVPVMKRERILTSFCFAVYGAAGRTVSIQAGAISFGQAMV
jgi:hypothetical protein